MKKNKLFTFLTMFFLMTILSTSVFAFDTDNAGPTIWSNAKTGDWGFSAFTGTRYIFRIECEDGVYRDIGYNNEVVNEKAENKSALYYINHFQRATSLTATLPNNTEDNENYLRTHPGEELIESVFMGSSLLGYTQVFEGAEANGYSYFDTNVSSTEKYDKSSYRHVTVWCRIGVGGGSVYTDNFNLSASDIEKLANTVKAYAKKNNDDITLAQINDIINGEKAYQIRAEILLKVHGAEGQYKWYEDKDISAKIEGTDTELLTFREMMALRGGSEFGPFSKIAALLFEKDKPWYDEYSNAYSFLNGSHQGKDFRYIGWDYIQINEDPFRKIEVKVIGVDEKTNKVIYSKDVDGNDISSDKIPKLDLPLKDFVIKESKYSPSGYKYLDEYEVEEGTSTFTGKGETSSGDRVTLNIDKSINAPRQVLIVFYYNADHTVEVQHIYVDPMTSGETLLESHEIPIEPLGEQKELSSIVPSGDYINYKYEGIYKKDGEENVIEDISGEKFKEYSVTNFGNLYTLTFTPTEEDGEYIIKFYYTSQIITVKHENESGDSIIDPVTKILDPTEEENSLGGYILKEYTLNGESQTDPLPIKVSLKDGKPSQELIFIYYPKDEGSNEKQDPDPEPTGDPKPTPVYGKLTVEPSNLNNQFMGQKDKKYYWVLNENGKVTIKLEVENMDSEIKSMECTLKIPFDVYINGTYKMATSEIKVSCKAKDGYYEGTVEKIYVPVWVTENTDYTLKATLSSDDNVNGEANVTVVGAVYDFTITNLDGSDVTGDSIWKNALFGESKKAKNTPIGQGTQQPQKYYEAIKRGTRFYFSLNTLGAANKSIEINPSFYYVSNDGKTVSLVNMESKYNGNTRGISLTDANRVTEEFTKERKMKSTLGGTLATNANIGGYDKITLGSDVSTPYLGIVKDVEAKFPGKEIGAILRDADKEYTHLYKVANHWYGDYSIPNDAEFYYADTSTKVDDENGYIVVYFSIKTKTENRDYLAYNLASPFVQTKKISEWIYERQENKLNVKLDNTLTLPKTNVSSSDATIVSEAWIKDYTKNSKLSTSGKTATIIYSLKPNVSTKQNVTSVGTH